MRSADVNDEIRSLFKAPSGFTGRLVRKGCPPLLMPDKQKKKKFLVTFSQHHSGADSCRNAFSNTSEHNGTEKFTLSLAITTRPRRTTPSQWSSFEPARGVATHRLIGEGGRLGGRHVVIGRLKRKLLHFLFLVEMNHLHRKQPRAQQGVMSSQNCTQQAGFRCRPPPPPHASPKSSTRLSLQLAYR